nr:MAG TPA: hypothetical protein [Caudoviricetes sp.]
MAKWCGKIGYGIKTEYEDGAWEDRIVERTYYGDRITDRIKRQSSGNVNDDISINNVISVVADPFAIENYIFMIYVEIMGVKWKVTSIEEQRPRLLLTVGGLYNGNTN